jgi:TIR domain
MDVFISWSGERSKYVAECLRVWLKQVIQAIKPWLSSEDILAGARWNGEIATHLSRTKFGIICVTPENLDSAGLSFEAGALAKTIDERTFVCPYLVELEEIDPQHPLSQFQCKRTNKEGTYDLVRSIHSALRLTNTEIDLTEQQVKEAYDLWWPKLEEQLTRIPDQPVEQIEEEQPDAINEILVLVKGVARSVSALQAQVFVTPTSFVPPTSFANPGPFSGPFVPSGPFTALMGKGGAAIYESLSQPPDSITLYPEGEENSEAVRRVSNRVRQAVKASLDEGLKRLKDRPSGSLPEMWPNRPHYLQRSCA